MSVANLKQQECTIPTCLTFQLPGFCTTCSISQVVMISTKESLNNQSKIMNRKIFSTTSKRLDPLLKTSQPIQPFLKKFARSELKTKKTTRLGLI